jgi:hypothetical protein
MHVAARGNRVRVCFQSLLGDAGNARGSFHGEGSDSRWSSRPFTLIKELGVREIVVK